MNGKLSFNTTSSGGLRPEGDIGSASLKALRAARLQLGKWTRDLNDRVTAGHQLSDAERADLRNVNVYAVEVHTALTAREAENEAARQEAMTAERTQDQAHSRLGIPGERAEAWRPTGRTFAEMFPTAGQSLDGWTSGAEFCRTIALGLGDLRLKAASMEGNIPSSGGFAIPPGVLGPWLDLALESEIVRPRAQVWPIIQGRERSVPAWDVTDRSTGIAGLVIDWEGEAPVTDAEMQVAKMRMLNLRARRGAIFAEASNELEADGLDFQSQMSTVMSRAIAYGLDQVFLLTGTGSNQPMSIFNSGALIQVTRQTANLIDYTDLTGMFARMTPGSIPNSVWVAHSSTIPQLATLSVPVGTGGSHVPVMTQQDGRFYILTRPVIFTEKVRPLGQLSDVALLDLTQYVIGVRLDASLDKSGHVGFKRNMMTYRLQLRIDGMPNISAPYQPPNSAPTQSPFVALAA